MNEPNEPKIYLLPNLMTVGAVDKGFAPTQVEAAFVATQRGTLWGQEGIGGNTIPTAIGLVGIPCTRIENACPSGSDAFRVGAMAVASGVARHVVRGKVWHVITEAGTGRQLRLNPPAYAFAGRCDGTRDHAFAQFMQALGRHAQCLRGLLHGRRAVEQAHERCDPFACDV